MNGAFIFISVSTTNNCIISVSVNVKSTVISFSRGIMRVNHWCVYFSAMILFCFLVERLSRQTQWMNVLTFLWKNTLHPVAWTTSPRSWACTRSTWSPSWGASSTCCAWTAPFLYRTGTTSPSWWAGLSLTFIGVGSLWGAALRSLCWGLDSTNRRRGGSEQSPSFIWPSIEF